MQCGASAARRSRTTSARPVRPSRSISHTEVQAMVETRYAVVDPGTGTEVRSYLTASDDQVRAAIATAHAAYRTWARPASVAERATCVRRASELLLERRDELAAIIRREM